MHWPGGAEGSHRRDHDREHAMPPLSFRCIVLPLATGKDHGTRKLDETSDISCKSEPGRAHPNHILLYPLECVYRYANLPLYTFFPLNPPNLPHKTATTIP